MNEKEFDFNHWDKGLDDLFREAADAEQPAAPPHAWLKMNQLLDEDDQKRRRRFGWWWLPLLLFMAGHQHFLEEQTSGSIISLTQSSNNNDVSIVFNSSIMDNSSDESKHPLRNVTSEKNLKNDHQQNLDILNSNAISTRGLKLDSPSSTTKKIFVRKKKKSSRDYNNNFTPEQKNKPANTIGRRTKSFNLSSNDTSSREEESIQSGRSGSNSNLSEENSLYPSMPKMNRISLPVTLTVPDPALPDQKITDSSKSEEETNFRFYIYAGAGADRGFINRNHTSDYKPAYGGGIGMQLNKRWAIQAGIFQTRKIYEAPGDAYTPKKGSYYDNPNYKIKEVYADCAILEIPVSIRYSFLQNKKQQFFGMLSAQTALMQRESYDYYYTRFGQPAKGYYTYRTNALELFSGIGFSVGYERKISNHLHWQIAPYFNLPTSGIGEGAVKLRSAGVFTGFRYSFWKKK